MPFSPSLVLTQQALEDPNAPRLCWINYVQPTNISATSELAVEPASNLGNPSTAFAWQADSTSQQDIDIDIVISPEDSGGVALLEARGRPERWVLLRPRADAARADPEARPRKRERHTLDAKADASKRLQARPAVAELQQVRGGRALRARAFALPLVDRAERPGSG